MTVRDAGEPGIGARLRARLHGAPRRPDEASAAAPARGAPSRLVVALDGHDGSGKSTLAVLIAERLGGRIVKPFGGRFGQYMLWLSGQRRYDLLSRVAEEELRRAVAAEPGDHPLVIDRHALTMGVLLSEPWRRRWPPLPHTVLCYADSSTVVRRLRERGEAVGREARHAAGIRRYRALAEAAGVPIIATRDAAPADAAAAALAAMGLSPGSVA
ncbi:hypothetical protein [Methylobacterium oryzihabitans]|uniref:Thymidylate kinase n=1 Tax=Methylobacterium oryzihabitans TaxID=2499852 RepID=A0A3S2VBJ3_9HYPH|nr:hypothetical protein [Methylobacterium oryzihabitans]RVU19143.1 hypothetical protein EOE48_09665 [Methylobacterium oryzihabitans]